MLLHIFKGKGYAKILYYLFISSYYAYEHAVYLFAVSRELVAFVKHIRYLLVIGRPFSGSGHDYISS